MEVLLDSVAPFLTIQALSRATCSAVGSGRSAQQRASCSSITSTVVLSTLFWLLQVAIGAWQFSHVANSPLADVASQPVAASDIMIGWRDQSIDLSVHLINPAGGFPQEVS